mmetsp:Transcript_149717/g.480764  ORF Transcript_149717/g.480764 Transcript_149717/m.480764 type:complete len:784 (+) Transcript_149717:619-2970(+)
MDLIFSSRLCKFTSHFCFSACMSRMSSCWCKVGPSTPLANLSFILLTSISNFSRVVSASTCRCCSFFTSAPSSCFATVELPLLAEISASSCFVLVTSGLPSHCSARCMRPARSSSSCLCRSCLRLHTLLAAFLTSSRWAWRSARMARLSSTCLRSSSSPASSFARIASSSWMRSCKILQLDSISRVGDDWPSPPSRRPNTKSVARCKTVAMASSALGSALAGVTSFLLTPFACEAPCPPPSSRFRLQAAAMANNWSNFRVFGTSLPLSTCSGSKSRLSIPKVEVMELEIVSKMSSLPSRESGHTSLKPGGKPVVWDIKSATSCTYFGGGRDRSSFGDRFLFRSSRFGTIFSKVASVPSALSSASSGTHSASGRCSLGGRTPPVGGGAPASSPVADDESWSSDDDAASARTRSASGPTAAPPGIKLVPRTTKAAVELISNEAKLPNSFTRASACWTTKPRILPTSSTFNSFMLGTAASCAPSACCHASPCSAPPTPMSALIWARMAGLPSTPHSLEASTTWAANSPTCRRASSSMLASFSTSRRKVSSLVVARRAPVRAMPLSCVSSPSTQSFRSSEKALWKSIAMVLCCFKASVREANEETTFSHCLSRSPDRNAAQATGPESSGGGGAPAAPSAPSAAGPEAEGSSWTVISSPRMESSRSAWSCSSLKRFFLSSSITRCCRLCSSMALVIWFSCCSLNFFFSSQLLLTIFCISASWASNFSFIACRSSSAMGPPPPPPLPPPPPPPPMSFFFNSSISAFSREIWEASSFLVAETLMAFARLA